MNLNPSKAKLGDHNMVLQSSVWNMTPVNRGLYGMTAISDGVAICIDASCAGFHCIVHSLQSNWARSLVSWKTIQELCWKPGQCNPAIVEVSLVCSDCTLCLMYSRSVSCTTFNCGCIPVYRSKSKK